MSREYKRSITYGILTMILVLVAIDHNGEDDIIGFIAALCYLPLGTYATYNLATGIKNSFLKDIEC